MDKEGSIRVKGEAILARMHLYGVDATLRTLQRYEAANLLPPARRGWGEGGFGRFAEYSPAAVAEFYASYSLVHRYLWKVRFEDDRPLLQQEDGSPGGPFPLEQPGGQGGKAQRTVAIDAPENTHRK